MRFLVLGNFRWVHLVDGMERTLKSFTQRKSNEWKLVYLDIFYCMPFVPSDGFYYPFVVAFTCSTFIKLLFSVHVFVELGAYIKDAMVSDINVSLY